MIINLVIDKKNNFSLFVFVNDNEIGRFIFKSRPKFVVDIHPLPGETGRKIVDTTDYKTIIVETSFSPSDFLIMDKSEVETLLKKLI